MIFERITSFHIGRLFLMQSRNMPFMTRRIIAGHPRSQIRNVSKVRFAASSRLVALYVWPVGK